MGRGIEGEGENGERGFARGVEEGRNVTERGRQYICDLLQVRQNWGRSMGGCWSFVDV